MSHNTVTQMDTTDMGAVMGVTVSQGQWVYDRDDRRRDCQQFYFLNSFTQWVTRACARTATKKSSTLTSKLPPTLVPGVYTHMYVTGGFLRGTDWFPFN